MAGFQSAANTITGAPARFNVQKSIVESLQRDLAGERAFNAAVGAVSNIAKTQAAGQKAEASDVKAATDALEEVPIERRQALKDILGSQFDLSERARTMTANYRSAADRLVDIYKASPNAITWAKKGKEIRQGPYYQAAKELMEEIRNGATETSR